MKFIWELKVFTWVELFVNGKEWERRKLTFSREISLKARIFRKLDGLINTSIIGTEIVEGNQRQFRNLIPF